MSVLSGESAPLYQYGRDFLAAPRTYDYIRLYQEGEMYNCYGHAIPEHRQICAEVSYIIAGSGLMFGGGREHPVKTGEFFLSCPGERHYILPDKQENLRYFYIGFDMDESRFLDRKELSAWWRFFSRPHASPVARCRFDTVTLMHRLNRSFGSGSLEALSVECLLKQILLDVYQSFHPPAPAPEEGASVGNTVYSVMRYIDAHICEPVRVEEIAKELGYSGCYLSHLFREKMGATIRQYLAAQKIAKSLELMENSKLSLTQIAERLGYDSLQSFDRSFKRVMGASPSGYLAEKRGAEPASSC